MSPNTTEAGGEPGHNIDAMGRDLAAFGPLMRQQDRIEAEGVSPTFAADLRARLMSQETEPGDLGLRGNLRRYVSNVRVARPVKTGRPAGSGPSVPLRSVSSRWILALVAALLVVVAEVAQPRSLPNLGFTPPHPSSSALTYSYPSLPVAINRLQPNLSLIRPAPGQAFAGHLQLTGSKISPAPLLMSTYRLVLPKGMKSPERLLHIRARDRRLTVGGVSWLVAVDGGGRRHRPMHSVAVSTQTQELIYHDRRSFKAVFTRRALTRVQTVRIARSWLSRLGWPATRMPVFSFGSLPGRRKVRWIAFGWAGVRNTDRDEAILWVTPNGNVVEALVWPPVSIAGLVLAREVSTAWTDVQAGKAPLAVEGVSPRLFANGSGTLQKSGVVWVLSPGPGRVSYLIPAFRFAGSARLLGKARPRGWFALTPAEAS